LSKYTFYNGLLLNLEQKIDFKRRRDYLSKEEAYRLLKKETGQDFGYDVKAWRDWLKKNRKIK